MKLLECIPNVSEGRDLGKIEAMAHAIRQVKGVKLLHTDTGYAANRTVFTFAGPPEAVIEAAMALYRVAISTIDMALHKGTHPRQGAVDVCPIVPLQGLNLEEAALYANTLAQKVNEAFGIPGYFYEKNAPEHAQKNLAFWRKGEYESLPKKFLSLPPHFGNASRWKKSGTTIIGARNLLIAYNINLNTSDENIAKIIASNIRESGKYKTKPNGVKEHIAGKLKSVKGIGWYIEDFKKAQVSYNLTNINKASMMDVFLATQKEAKKAGVQVTGSELIGLAPLSQFIIKPPLHKADEENQVAKTIAFLGLNEFNPFDPKKRIIEYLMES